MQFKLPKSYEKILFLALYLSLGFYLQKSRFSDLTKVVHPWAQSDRYALSLGFLNNNFNLLKPETYLMNREFPGNFTSPSKNSITSVNLPLHEFFVAVFMKIFNTRSVLVFRVYNFIISFIGLFALFRISRLLKVSFINSLFLVGIYFFSPIFLIYQVCTLGVVNTTSFVFLGFYLYLLFLQNKKWNFYYLSIFIFTIACLIRTTALVPFVALLVTETIRIRRQKKFNIRSASPVLLSFLALSIHYYYMNVYMMAEYGSLFLHYLKPANDWKEAISIAKKAYSLWFFTYFSISQWVILALLSLVGSVLFLKQKSSTILEWFLGFFSITLCFGCLLFLIAMWHQYRDHDYYAIDTFMIPILLAAILFIKVIQKCLRKYKVYFELICLLLLITIGVEGKQRMMTGIQPKPWQTTQIVAKEYAAVKKEFQKFSTSNEDKILVVGAELCPQIPFILLNRKGFILNKADSSFMRNVLTWDYDFLCFREKRFLTSYHQVYPDFINHFSILSNKDGVVIAKKSNQLHQYKLNDFINLSDFLPYYSDTLNFNNADTNWSIINTNKEGVGFVPAKNEFGLTFRKEIESLTKSQIKIYISSKIKSINSLDHAELVVSLTDDTTTNKRHYESIPIRLSKPNQDGWRSVSIFTTLDVLKGKEIIGIYFWNRGFEEFLYKDVQISIYKKRS